MSRNGKAHRCAWCGLLGHNRATCHVEAEGRRDTDAADRLACDLLVGVHLASSRSTSATRGDIAARIRARIESGALVVGFEGESKG